MISHHIILAGSYTEAWEYAERYLDGVERKDITILTPTTRAHEMREKVIRLNLAWTALHWTESDRAFLRPSTSDSFEKVLANKGVTWTQLRTASKTWLITHGHSQVIDAWKDSL